LAISNARLYEAAEQRQRGLAARLQQLEHLAETLAHDLKGPGARMGELARLLVQQNGCQFDDRTNRWLSLIEENGRDLVERVEGILTVARVGTDQGAITAVDPTAIIDQVLKANAGEIERLRAVVHVEPGLPLVACHGAYLRQIFDNLVSNALKFTRAGESPLVRISGRIAGPMVAFSVKDQGIGIPSTQRIRVFQPFVRLLMSEAAGSGIGLTIIQRIEELYGGKVTDPRGRVARCYSRSRVFRSMRGLRMSGCRSRGFLVWLMSSGERFCEEGGDDDTWRGVRHAIDQDQIQSAVHDPDRRGQRNGC